ncbi:hypothetical protein R1flu_013553 [Riccia fluitans]|uniref:Uncharacterized protein n=1 Tax=Riccia fluitans TaxID=41844 RepID=A0ABD1YH96_9MARC
MADRICEGSALTVGKSVSFQNETTDLARVSKWVLSGRCCSACLRELVECSSSTNCTCISTGRKVCNRISSVAVIFALEGIFERAEGRWSGIGYQVPPQKYWILKLEGFLVKRVLDHLYHCLSL